jgi:hypothetical protein
MRSFTIEMPVPTPSSELSPIKLLVVPSVGIAK